MPNINDYGLPFTSEDGDRKYSALEWREYFSRLIHNGLIQNAANECQVKPQAAPNKTVYVDIGVVFINGAMRILEEPFTLIIAENTSGNPRIDRVVARLNEASRTIEFAVLEGTPTASPVAPTLTRAAGVYELGLADITLVNGYSTITAAEITDQRWDVSLCGASSMTIGVIPPSGLDAVTVQLEPETQARYDVQNVEEGLKKALKYAENFTSYQAFCSAVSAISIAVAFGEKNEEFSKRLGLQLAMYAWWKGSSKSVFTFPELIKMDTFPEIIASRQATKEMGENLHLAELLRNAKGFPLNTHWFNATLENSRIIFKTGLGYLPGFTGFIANANYDVAADDTGFSFSTKTTSGGTVCSSVEFNTGDNTALFFLFTSNLNNTNGNLQVINKSNGNAVLCTYALYHGTISERVVVTVPKNSNLEFRWTKTSGTTASVNTCKITQAFLL